MLVDDLQGTDHQAYGGMADPTYLINVDGRVAFYNIWPHVPTLYRAIEELLRRGGRGVVNEGIDRVPHLLASMTDGWKGLRLGLPQSLIDLETAFPGTGIAPWLGYQIRPILAPLTLQEKPLPTAARRFGGPSPVSQLVARPSWASYRAARAVAECSARPQSRF